MINWRTIAFAALVIIAAALIAGCSKQQPAGAENPPVSEEPAGASKAEPTPQAGDSEADQQFTYTCPMHPEVQKQRPGKCPDCGMFLQADTDQAVEYFCPMHEKVVQKKPAKCPDCGMFLEARLKEQ